MVQLKAGFNAGFIPAHQTAEKLSPGSIVINTNKISHLFIGHLMIFSCHWGANSLYSGNTTACSTETYVSQCESAKYTGKTQLWKIPIDLRVDYQRVLETTIVMVLSWEKDAIYDTLKKYEILCRFFDTEDQVYQPDICASCWKNGRNCSECWDAASLDGFLTPSFQFLSPDYVISKGVIPEQQLFILQTSHGNITDENGMFNAIPTCKDHFNFYDIFQYDYINGRYSTYMQNINTPKMSDAHNNHRRYFSKAVILPGNQKTPTDLSKEQLKSLATICRIRSLYIGNSSGAWSYPVWSRLNETKFFDSHFTFEVAGDAEKDGKNYFLHYSNDLFGKKYEFLVSNCKEKKNSSIFLFYLSNAHSTTQFDTDGHAKMEQSDVHADNEPLYMKCAALQRFLLWSEKIQENKFRLLHVKLDKELGQPLALTKMVLDVQKLCECSNQRSMTSFSFDIIYRNLSNPENVEIAIVCGSVVCLYDPTMGKSSKLVKFPPKIGNKKVICISVDQEELAVVTEGPIDDEIHHIPIKQIGLELTDQSVFTYPTAKAKRKHKFKPAVYLPVPPKHCMDPYTDHEQTSVGMSDNSTIFIQLGISWDNSAECDQFFRPSVDIQMNYAKIPNYMKITEDPGIPCTSIRSLMCKTLQKLDHHHEEFKANISEAVPNRYYLIEINIRAAFSQEVYDIWYAGSTVVQSQTLRKVIFTHYSEIPAYVWITVAAVVATLVVFMASGVFYWSYTRKMYMYKYLSRISARDIHKQKKLGEGNFGEVWKATLGKDTIVVKMLKEAATDREEKEFREEALLLSKFSSDYIIKAVGICLQSRPIMLALEFVNGGSLDSYLKEEELRSQLHSDDLFQITEQALKGCIYLEQEGYIHRDIASRNCLVSTVSDVNKKPKCVKLSDFGLAKDIGSESVYRSRNPDADTLPIAWTAPEAFSGKFSPKSDVWAFGVLIWEIFTWAATPYGPCSCTDDTHICPLHMFSHDEIEFKVCAERKTLLSFPDPCTAAFCSALNNVMSVCWEFPADDRPSFKQLQKYLNGAKSEILKTDVQIPSAHTISLSAPQQIDLASPSGMHGKAHQGAEGRRNWMTDAYTGHVNLKSYDKQTCGLLNKGDDLSAKDENQEAAELLPMLSNVV